MSQLYGSDFEVMNGQSIEKKEANCKAGMNKSMNLTMERN
jgi:hypothetical protein